MTGEREILAELEEARARFRSLMDNCVDGMIIIDEDGTVLEFNPAAEGIFGYPAGEVVGRNVSMLMPEPDRSRHDGYLRRYLETGKAGIIGIGREVVGRSRDGTTFPMDLSVGEMPHGGSRHFIGVIRDISERRTIERQLLQASKMEAVGQLTGGIAHDFNNLLAVLMMDLEMLEPLVADSADARELVDEAISVARTGADLTQRLLAFSRRQSLVPARVDIGALVQSTTAILRRTLGESVGVETTSPANLWQVFIDRGQFENTVVNLAINARDAMPEGGRLSISCVNVTLDEAAGRDFDELEPGDYVRVRVRDTGTGMSPDVASRVFEPFYTTKEGGHGTGLGLSMVYGFVKQSGGHVALASEEGRGTTVDLYFPRAAAEAPEAANLLRRPETPTGNERILLVEDDVRLREGTTRSLTGLGYRVDTAADGDAAMKIFESGRLPDLLLSDIVMPGALNGIALAQQVAGSHPLVRIVLMSGYAEDAETIAELARAGVTLLRKPFTRRQLAAAVRQALDA